MKLNLKYFFYLSVILLILRCTTPDSIYNKKNQKSETEQHLSPNITLYFTDPVNDTQMSHALIEKIKQQSSSVYLDLCFFGFNMESVIQSIEDAISRGIHVRFIGNICSKDGSLLIALGTNTVAAILSTNTPSCRKRRCLTTTPRS